jgi:hypothetical protein
MKTIGNPFMKVILHSPLHPFLSKNTVVIFVSGRISGVTYSLPVNYQQQGDIVWITSMCDRTWWKNLREGAKVSLRLRGKDFDGWGEVFEDNKEVAEYLKQYLHLQPAYAKYFDIGIDAGGELYVEDLTKAAENRVMVRVTLS